MQSVATRRLPSRNNRDGLLHRGRVVVVCFSEISISMFFLSSEYLNEVANLQKVSTGFIIDFIVELM